MKGKNGIFLSSKFCCLKGRKGKKEERKKGKKRETLGAIVNRTNKSQQMNIEQAREKIRSLRYREAESASPTPNGLCEEMPSFESYIRERKANRLPASKIKTLIGVKKEIVASGTFQGEADRSARLLSHNLGWDVWCRLRGLLQKVVEGGPWMECGRRNHADFCTTSLAVWESRWKTLSWWWRPSGRNQEHYSYSPFHFSLPSWRSAAASGKYGLRRSQQDNLPPMESLSCCAWLVEFDPRYWGEYLLPRMEHRMSSPASNAADNREMRESFFSESRLSGPPRRLIFVARKQGIE